MISVNSLIDQPRRLWRFLGIFQPRLLRVLHLSVVMLVVIQLVSIALSEQFPVVFFVHIAGGISLCVLSVIFCAYCFKLRGLRHYFSYLWGDAKQLKKDVEQTVHLKITPPRPYGLAASVRGFGFIALVCAGFSGLLWFVLFKFGIHAKAAGGMHSFFATVLVIYLIMHGGMAIVRYVLWQRKMF